MPNSQSDTKDVDVQVTQRVKLEGHDQEVTPMRKTLPPVQCIPAVTNPKQTWEEPEQYPGQEGQQHQQLDEAARVYPLHVTHNSLVQKPEGDHGREEPTLCLQRVLCLSRKPRLHKPHLNRQRPGPNCEQFAFHS